MSVLMQKALNIIFILLLAVPVLSYAQSKKAPVIKVKFGNISEEEIAMKQYDKDPDATAVVLFDIGHCEPAGRSQAFKRHRRIKIFKKEGYRKANLAIAYNRTRRQAIRELEAICYNEENGKLTETKLSKENIFDEEFNKDISLQKITVPGVREGSIIDIKYTLFNSGVESWYFQDNIPTLWSEYKLVIPEYYNFLKIDQGITPFLFYTATDEYETEAATMFSYRKYSHHWIQKDVPAIKAEKYISSIEDYKTKISFYLESVNFPGQLTEQIIPSWTQLSKTLLSDVDFGKFIDNKNALEDELSTVVKPNMTPMQKTKAVYAYVGKTFEASNSSEELSMTTSISKIKEKKKVTATEKNFILMNMLRTSGIQAEPVLIRTRDEGRVGTELAVVSRFNRVITQVILEKDTFLIDASGYPQPMKLLPFEALSGYGVKLWDEDKHEVVAPHNIVPNRKYVQMQLSIGTEGQLLGDVSILSSGYEAYNIRKALKENGEERVSQDIFKAILADGKLEEHAYDDTELTSDLPIKGSYKIATNAYVNKVEDKIYLNPFICFGEKENPFKTDERLYNIDYGAPTDEYFNLTITIPDGYKLEEVPETLRFIIPDGTMKFEYLAGLKDNILTINAKLVIKRTRFGANEYLVLKKLYGQMIAKIGEQLVLKKIEK
jgi:hypothetical protein